MPLQIKPDSISSFVKDAILILPLSGFSIHYRLFGGTWVFFSSLRERLLLYGELLEKGQRVACSSESTFFHSPLDMSAFFASLSKNSKHY